MRNIQRIVCASFWKKKKSSRNKYTATETNEIHRRGFWTARCLWIFKISSVLPHPLTIEKKGKIWIKCTSTFERYLLINPPFMQLAPLTKQKRRLWISSVELTNRINMNCPSFTPSVNFNCFKIPLLLLIIFFCRSTNTPLNIESRDQKWDRK